MADMGNGVKKQRKTLKIRSPPRSLSIENYSDSRITNRGLKRYRKKENFFPTIFALCWERERFREIVANDRCFDVSSMPIFEELFFTNLFRFSSSFLLFSFLSLSLFSRSFFTNLMNRRRTCQNCPSSGIMIFSILAVHGPGFRGKSRVSLRVLRSFSEEGPLGWLGCFIRKGGDR